MTKPRTIDLRIKIDDVLIVESNDGGYLGGYCLGCKATGWFGESGNGYPSSAGKNGPVGLRHKPIYPFGHLLKKDGSFR